MDYLLTLGFMLAPTLAQVPNGTTAELAVWIGGVLLGAKLATDFFFKFTDYKKTKSLPGSCPLHDGSRLHRIETKVEDTLRMHDHPDPDRPGAYEWWCKWNRQDRDRVNKLIDRVDVLIRTIEVQHKVHSEG